ncbi:MAG: MBL fold metallo-hydrolase [Bacteroidia bacterium]|nr:MBL fold metallo-hydrolase [Bacteroidia bacterium]
MIRIACFTFNPFAENTYVLSDNTGECVIIDPGCYDDRDRRELADYIEDNQLKPVHLLNTHGHIDHVFGNKFVCEKWQIPVEIHREDLKTLQAMAEVARLYSLNAEISPEPGGWLEEGVKVLFGQSGLEVLFTPGHSPGSVCFYHPGQKFLIGGDVLFRESIGRTDLPGGDHSGLLNNITTKLFTLPEEVTVYPGHGPETTIGHEKRLNPFVGGGQ